jgi:hypothetical protein
MKDNIIVNILMGIFLVSLVPLMAMQEQMVNVRIQVAGDKKIKFAEVPLSDVSKEVNFGIMPKLPLETYFPVVAAGYEDTLDVHGCARMQKDLREDIPYSIQQEEIMGKTAREQNVLKKRCLFPRHISQSFIDRINQGNNKYIIYGSDDRTITAHYELEWLQQAKKAETGVLPVQEKASRSHYTLPPLFNSGDNFMSIAALCAFLLCIAV